MILFELKDSIKDPSLLSRSLKNPFLFKTITLLNKDNLKTTRVVFREPLTIETEFDVEKSFDYGIRIGAVICSLNNQVITALHQTDDHQFNTIKLPIGKYSSRIKIELDLMPGSYKISLFAKIMPGFWSSQDYSLDYIENALIFSIEEPLVKNNHDENPILYSGGIILPRSNWSIIRQSGIMSHQKCV